MAQAALQDSEGSNSIQLEDGWKHTLSAEFAKPYMQDLKNFLQNEKQAGKKIFPKGSQYFRALDLTPLEDVKVVILGQDPYHGPNQAHGLSFSVQKGVRIPPSLKNIYKELHDDIQMDTPDHGFLEGWAKQGVLLLNTSLTVEQGQAGSHQGKGWEIFTDAVIREVNSLGRPVVFILWGAHAGKKKEMIDDTRHCILTAPHPSPFSADRGFFGCRHFSKANDFLIQSGQTPINWADL